MDGHMELSVVTTMYSAWGGPGGLWPGVRWRLAGAARASAPSGCCCGGAAGGSRGKEGPLGETGELVAWSCLPVGPAERWVTGRK